MDICFWGAGVVHWHVNWCLGSRYVSGSFIGWLSIFDFQGYLMTFGFEVLFYQWEWNIYFPNAYFRGVGRGRGASNCRGFRACSGRFGALPLSCCMWDQFRGAFCLGVRGLGSSGLDVLVGGVWPGVLGGFYRVFCIYFCDFLKIS